MLEKEKTGASFNDTSELGSEITSVSGDGNRDIDDPLIEGKYFMKSLDLSLPSMK